MRIYIKFKNRQKEGRTVVTFGKAGGRGHWEVGGSMSDPGGGYKDVFMVVHFYVRMLYFN